MSEEEIIPCHGQGYIFWNNIPHKLSVSQTNTRQNIHTKYTGAMPSNDTDRMVMRWCYGPLARYAKLRVAHAPGSPGTFSLPPTLKETASLQSRHASRHVRHARAVMHVGIAKPRWRGKRSRQFRRMLNPQFYVSGKRSIDCTVAAETQLSQYRYQLAEYDDATTSDTQARKITIMGKLEQNQKLILIPRFYDLLFFVTRNNDNRALSCLYWMTAKLPGAWITQTIHDKIKDFLIWLVVAARQSEARLGNSYQQ